MLSVMAAGLVLYVICSGSIAALNLPFSLPSPQFEAPAIVTAPHPPDSTSSTRELTLRHTLHYLNSSHLAQKTHTPKDLTTYHDFISANSSLSASRNDDRSSRGYLATLSLKTKRRKIWKPQGSYDEWNAARRRSWLLAQSARGSLNATMLLKAESDEGVGRLEWGEEEIEMPDVQDLDTLRSLAMMTSNSYNSVGEGEWYDLGENWNVSDTFGWSTGDLRGHIFATPSNSTVVIAIKGTSNYGLNGPTGRNDKHNDNLLFSCCCARIDWTWSPVCPCYTGDSVYFPLATSLYHNVSLSYPDANIWIAGHSLGGGLAALLGLTFGVPAVAFESPGDLLPANRLHLPLPPGADNGAVTHVFHTADPIPMGTCTGALSSCSAVGLALETRCHIGKVIVYDTVGIRNWTVDVRTHSINNVIENVLLDDWKDPAGDGPEEGDGDEDGGEKRRPFVPKAEVQACDEEFGDCFKWQFVDDAVVASGGEEEQCSKGVMEAMGW